MVDIDVDNCRTPITMPNMEPNIFYTTKTILFIYGKYENGFKVKIMITHWFSLKFLIIIKHNHYIYSNWFIYVIRTNR